MNIKVLHSIDNPANAFRIRFMSNEDKLQQEEKKCKGFPDSRHKK